LRLSGASINFPAYPGLTPWARLCRPPGLNSERFDQRHSRRDNITLCDTLSILKNLLEAAMEAQFGLVY